MYPKSKGLTEEGIAALGYSSAVIFRPGLLLAPGGRQERRIPEWLAVQVIPRLPFGKTTLSIQTPILGRVLIRAALDAAKVGTETELKGYKARVVGNPEALELGGAHA